ncbi:PRP6 factor, partial [Crocuta crocuta]
QVPLKPALWALLLALLGLAPGQAGLHACSVPDVLRHYRVVIFEDLQAAVRQVGPGAGRTGPGSRHLHFIQKNLTEAAALGRQDRAGASCSAQKEHDILLSIASLGQTLRRVVARGHRRGALEKAAWTVALRTEALMRRHCWMLHQQGGRPKRRPPQRHSSHSSRSQRRLLLRVLDTVATCWEKLFALRAAATEGS